MGELASLFDKSIGHFAGLSADVQLSLALTGLSIHCDSTMDNKRKADSMAMMEMAPPKQPRNELVAADPETKRQLMAAVST